MKSEKNKEASVAEELELEAVRGRLTSWFAGKMPQASGLALSPLQRPGGGSSNKTFFAELRFRQDGAMRVENLVIRWVPRGFNLFPKYDMKEQFRLMEQLEKTAIPVPRTRWFEEDEAVLGVPFYIVDQVPGWIPGDFPPYHVAGPLYEATPAAKVKVWQAAVDTMAKIHTLDWERAGLGLLGVPEGGTDSLERLIAYYEKMLRMNEETPPPILAEARDWLRANAYVPKHLSLCWGDARMANLIYSDDAVRAVLDWEMAFIGDPESDLGWFIHLDWALSDGHPYSPSARLAGLPGTKETIDYYERVTNRKVENFFYHEVFATWRLAVVCTRVEKIQKYSSLSKKTPGYLTWPHFEQLRNLLGL
jgi:aminoglycoside phosphotransferase (APT) family kinase protein